MPSPRKKGTREVNQSFYIFCEGEKTEPNYFKGLIADLNFPLHLASVEVLRSPHTDLVGLVEEAKEHMRESGAPKDQYWVVVDKDGYTQHAKGFSNAKNSGINIAFSSVCFEYWIYLHLGYSSASCLKCKEVIDRLVKSKISNYEKKDPNIYGIVKHGIETAIVHSKRIQSHWASMSTSRIYNLTPYTDVDKLVEALREFRKNLKEKYKR